MIAEDWDKGVFNWPKCIGFKQRPTDHYMRSAVMRNKVLGDHEKDVCYWSHVTIQGINTNEALPLSFAKSGTFLIQKVDFLKLLEKAYIHARSFLLFFCFSETNKKCTI